MKFGYFYEGRLTRKIMLQLFDIRIESDCDCVLVIGWISS